MAKYNTFNLVDTKTKRSLLVTSSARKCKSEFVKGYRIDVWNENKLVNVIYNRNLHEIDRYVRAEKDHIASKQAKAEKRNKKNKERARAIEAARNGRW
jgi:hypothetical protein